MSVLRHKTPVGVMVIIIALAAALFPPGVQAAPLHQQPILFDQEYPLSITLDDATPQILFSLPCTQSKVASVYVETVSGDLSVDATLTAPDGSSFASGNLVSSNPNVTAAEAFIMPATGLCTLTLSRVGATSGRADLRLLSGYGRLTKWEAFDGTSSPLRMAWEPYVSENMDVRIADDGRLLIQVIRDNLMGYAVPNGNDLIWKDFYIQADFEIEGSPSYFEFGFVLRADEDVESFYSATISSDGDYSVYFYNGEWTSVQDWTVSTLIDTADHQPRMGVWVQGNTFRLYFNDQLIAEVTDTNLYAAQGTIGLAAATGVDQFDPLAVRMDNVVITTPLQGSEIAALPFGGNNAAEPTPTTGSGLSSGLFGGATKEPTPKPPAATLPPVLVPTVPPVPTLPPTPRPTNTPEPVQGLVLVNWASNEPSSILRELQDYGLIPSGGSLQIDVPSSYGDTSSSGFSFYSLGRGQTFRNFVLSFDAKLVNTGPESGCGMYFRSSSSYSNSVLVMEDGAALLGEWDSAGNLTDASYFDYHGAINTGQGATNRLIVVALEENVLMYINGQLITAAEFTAQTGEIALEMYVAEDDFGQTVPTYCQLNNIWLWQL